MTLRAQHDVAVQGLAAQVEVAVVQADLFRVVRLAEHRQRQLGGLGQHLERRAPAPRSRRSAGSGSRSRRARATTSPSMRITLSARSRSATSKPGVAGIEHQLGQAVMVAQVDEHQPAVVALAVDPARQAHIAARVRQPQGAAGVGAIGVQRTAPPAGPFFLTAAALFRLRSAAPACALSAMADFARPR